MISEEIYKQALEVVKLYELQQHKRETLKSLPIIEDGMILEYNDFTGNWYEYTKELQENIHFTPPLRTRVRSINTPQLKESL